MTLYDIEWRVVVNDNARDEAMQIVARILEKDPKKEGWTEVGDTFSFGHRGLYPPSVLGRLKRAKRALERIGCDPDIEICNWQGVSFDNNSSNIDDLFADWRPC